MSKRLKRGSVTREELYKEYRDKYPECYWRSRFCDYLRLYMHQGNPVMHMEHKAGDKMYVDFTGRRLSITSRDGSTVSVEVFVAILGCSQLTYVEAVASQKRKKTSSRPAKTHCVTLAVSLWQLSLTT